MDFDPIIAADFNARHWEFDAVRGPIAPGSEAQYQMLTRLLPETYNPYKPAVLDWPKLDADTLRRIKPADLDIAVQTEIKAAARITAYAETVAEPQLRAALLHMAGEEARHRDVLSRLVAAYDIPMKPKRRTPPERPRMGLSGNRLLGMHG